MPTDLPPDYVPKPSPDPDSPPAPSPKAPGETGSGDVVDPTGWKEPPVAPGDVPVGVPTPAGTPTF